MHKYQIAGDIVQIDYIVALKISTIQLKFPMTTIAPILHRAVSKIRFCVDSVTPCLQPLPLQSAKLQFEQRYEKPLLAFSHTDSFEVIQDKGIHPLAAAVHYAFSQHRPLLLTPDIIWMVLAQGFAQHINNCAEELRSSFVRHSGKKVLQVTVNGLSEPHHWATAIQEWSLQIRDFVGADLYRLMECNFSTSTPTTRTVSHIVMMDAFQQYFDYQCYCVCGIPNITFLGTVEDWQNIRARVELMGEYDFRCCPFVKNLSKQRPEILTRSFGNLSINPRQSTAAKSLPDG